VDESRLTSVVAVAALEEPTRRRLYEHVVRQPAPVSKDEAAAALELPRTTAAFHLDKLAGEGLLSVVFERRTGRFGPGAGRPAKLYRRSDKEVEVSLPERAYDVAGRLLAAAIEDAEASGESAREALARRSDQYGETLGRTGRTTGIPTNDDDTLAGNDMLTRVLEAQGFEPRRDGNAILLGNCPFHALAKEHPALVCGMNQHLLTGLLRGLGDTDFEAEVSPAAGHCCVRLTTDAKH
jgi:predicted ArsR family transcriptional regulator